MSTNMSLREQPRKACVKTFTVYISGQVHARKKLIKFASYFYFRMVWATEGFLTYLGHQIFPNKDRIQTGNFHSKIFVLKQQNLLFSV